MISGGAFPFSEKVLPKIDMTLKIYKTTFECYVPRIICGVCVIFNNHGCEHLVVSIFSVLSNNKKIISLKISFSIFVTGISIYGTKRHSVFGNISKNGNISKMTTVCPTGIRRERLRLRLN